jgi:hypothetical protein
MAGLLTIGAEFAMLLRDLIRGRRDTYAWFAMILALGFFVPYVPVAARQSKDLMYGHSLDYLGPSVNYPLFYKAALVVLAASLTLWIIYGRDLERDPAEPLRWLVALAALPTLAFAVGTVILHPMFNPRYLSPAIAATSILIAGGLRAWSVKWRNLLAASFALLCLILAPFAKAKPQPWRELARQVTAEGGASQPVFFESGFVSNGSTEGLPNAGFPFGYYSVVFDYYFGRPDRNVVVPGWDPKAARELIESKVSAAGGGWLASWKNEAAVKSELPDSKNFKIATVHREPELGIYRITPIPH